jgi:hypothetical protein
LSTRTSTSPPPTASSSRSRNRSPRRDTRPGGSGSRRRPVRGSG